MLGRRAEPADSLNLVEYIQVKFDAVSFVVQAAPVLLTWLNQMRGHGTCPLHFKWPEVRVN